MPSFFSPRPRARILLVCLLSSTTVLAACGGGGGGDDGGQSAAPTVTLSASALAVGSGSSVTLSWSSTNTASCSASGGWSGSLATSGSRAVGSLTQRTTFAINCSGAGGSATASTSVDVAPTPTVTLAANPAIIATGQTTTLQWSSTNAAACNASGAWTGNRAASGAESTAALAQATAYTLSCSGPGGSRTAAITVLVASSAPVVTLSATPTVAAGEYAELRWWTSQPATCVASGDWSGGRDHNGRDFVGPLTRRASYGLECSNAFGTSAATAAVQVDDSVTIASVQFLRLRSGKHFEGLGGVSDSPPLGPGNIRVRLRGPAQLAEFRLVDLGGDEIQVLQLAREEGSNELDSSYLGEVSIPSTPFKVAANGTRTDGAPFEASWEEPFVASSLSIDFEGEIEQPRPGQSLNAQLRVTNGGASGGVLVVCSAPAVLTLTPSTTTIAMTAASSQLVPLRIAVASSVSRQTALPAILCSALMTNDSSEGASSTARLVLPIRIIP